MPWTYFNFVITQTNFVSITWTRIFSLEVSILNTLKLLSSCLGSISQVNWNLFILQGCKKLIEKVALLKGQRKKHVKETESSSRVVLKRKVCNFYGVWFGAQHTCIPSLLAEKILHCVRFFPIISHDSICLICFG